MSTAKDLLRYAIIGCGRPHRTDGATGFGMGHWHARAFRASGRTRLVALADINCDNAEAFRAAHGDDQTRIYADYRQMLREQSPDIVSICTWPKFHAEMVIAAAEAGVRAIHCEKPIATTFGDARRMIEVCTQRGVQLTFNHQRRFNTPFRTARDMLRSGRIGRLLRIEASCDNLFDWGTHWFDMMFFYNGETAAEWVIGQIDTSRTHTIFGQPVEGQGLAHVRFANGVHGLMVTGHQAEWEAENRLIGTDGVIEVAPKAPATGSLRIWSKDRPNWEEIDDGSIHDVGLAITAGVADLLDALQDSREPELSAARAMRVTELIFATYESSRRRGRVDLPLKIDDNPLLELLGKG